jgi:hypothetical protein
MPLESHKPGVSSIRRRLVTPSLPSENGTEFVQGSRFMRYLGQPPAPVAVRERAGSGWRPGHPATRGHDTTTTHHLGCIAAVPVGGYPKVALNRDKPGVSASNASTCSS